MSSEAGGDSSAEQRESWRERLVKVPLRVWGSALGALVLGTSGLFGGLDPVAKPGLANVPPGTAYQGQPWTVTVTGAGVTTNAPPAKLKKDGDRWIVVAVTVEITDDESHSDIGDVLRLRLPGVLTTKPDRMLLGRDQSSTVSTLHPGLPEKIYLIWEQSGTEPSPAQLDIEIIGKTERLNSLTGHLNWLDDEPKALVTIAIKNLDTSQ